MENSVEDSNKVYNKVYEFADKVKKRLLTEI